MSVTETIGEKKSAKIYTLYIIHIKERCLKAKATYRLPNDEDDVKKKDEKYS